MQEGYDNEVRRDQVPDIPYGYDYKNNVGMNIPTYSYFNSDEVSSAAQKAVRRGFYSEAIQWFLELYFTSNHRRTNIWNRALVMAVEDIGPADPLMILKIYYLFKIKSEQALITAAILLAKSKKTRVNDWLAHIHDKVIFDDEELDQLQNKLLLSLQNYDLQSSIYYADALYMSKRKYRNKNSQICIWNVFDTMNSCYVNTLKEIALMDNWRWNEKSRLIYIHIILLWCSKRVPPISSIIINIDNEVNEILDKFMKRINLVGIPEYALDKHTRRGKSLGRGIKHFIEEAAKLNNEDITWKPLSDYALNIINNNLDKVNF